MALMAKSDGEGKHFDPVPEGPHIAVCYLVADLGTHHDDRYDKDTHRVLIGWEIPDERITITRDGEELDLPRVISQRYTLSLHEKANLRKDLEAWRGKRFTDKELGGFDLQQVLEVGCQLQVIHTQKEEKTYANIGALMALPKGVKTPKTENEPLWFSFQESTVEDIGIPEGMHDWIVNIIKDSQEYEALTSGAYSEQGPPEVDDDIPMGDVSEDLPF